MKLNHSWLLLILISGLFFFSCKGPDTKVAEQVTPSAPVISGEFYLIQCPKEEFNKLTKPSNGNGDPRGNVVFKYFIQDGKFTFQGWEIKGSNQNDYRFDTLPNIQFTPTSTVSSIKYGNLTSLGDFVLDKNQVFRVQQAILNRGHNFVVFSPKLSTGGALYWEVGTSLNALSLTAEEVEPVEDTDLRPIPPYRYDLIESSFLSK
jgi:hypothetical protein